MTQISRRRNFMLCMNSCTAMILSKCLLIIIKTLPLYALAKSTETTLLIQKGVYDLNIPDTHWSSDLVVIFYSLPPFISLIIAIISLIAVKSFSLHNSSLSLLIFWLFLISWTDLYLSIFTGLITREGLGYVAQYLYLPEIMYLIGAILSLLLLPLGAFFTLSTIDELQKQICPEIPYMRDKHFITPTITFPVMINSLLAFSAYQRFELLNIIGYFFLLVGVCPIILSRTYYSAPYAEIIKQRTFPPITQYALSIAGAITIILINRNDLKL